MSDGTTIYSVESKGSGSHVSYSILHEEEHLIYMAQKDQKYTFCVPQTLNPKP